MPSSVHCHFSLLHCPCHNVTPRQCILTLLHPYTSSAIPSFWCHIFCRLLSRAKAAKEAIYRTSHNCGRAGSAESEMAFHTLDDVIVSLNSYRLAGMHFSSSMAVIFCGTPVRVHRLHLCCWCLVLLQQLTGDTPATLARHESFCSAARRMMCCEQE